MHSIAVVIPNHKRPKLLDRLLTSISKASLPSSLTGIWVVENGGKEGAAEVCGRWSSELPVHYLYSDVANLSNARNVGATHADADFIIFFDDDLRCDEKTLEAYDEAIQKYGFDHFYGGPLGIDYEKKPPQWLMAYLPWSVQGLDKGVNEKSFDEPVFLGGNHAVPKRSLLAVGGYDQFSASSDGGAGGEEVRLQKKLLDLNHRGIYMPDANVWHFVPERRCSISWALNRHYRLGLTDGIFEAKKGKSSTPFLMGAPRWIWKKHTYLMLKGFVLRLTNSDDAEKSFAVRHSAHYYRGMIDGYRTGKDN